MVHCYHKFQKLSQLETMRECACADSLPITDQIEIRNLADALIHTSLLMDKQLADANRGDATVTAMNAAII